jgi:hypothetical protein
MFSHELKLESCRKLQETFVAGELQIRVTKRRVVRQKVVVYGVAVMELDIVEVTGNVLRVIEDVEGLDTDFEFTDLSEIECLLHLKVDVVDTAQRHRLASAGSKRSRPSYNILRIGVKRHVSDNWTRCSIDGARRSYTSSVSG